MGQAATIRTRLASERTDACVTGDRTVRRWVLAWAAAPILGIINGATRELAYKERIGESTANQISAIPLIALLGLYFWVLQRRWPLATPRDALSTGGVWVGLTVLFEFGFGHYVTGDSWDELLENYNVRKGNLWIIVLLWIAVGPATTRTVAARRAPRVRGEKGTASKQP